MPRDGKGRIDIGDNLAILLFMLLVLGFVLGLVKL